MYISNIIRNLAITQCNHNILANSILLIETLIKISNFGSNKNPLDESSILGPLEIIQFRNDTLQIISLVAWSLELKKIDKVIIKSLFNLFLSYIANKDECEVFPAGFPIHRNQTHPFFPPYEAGVPYWKDIALEAAAIISTPETNRDILKMILTVDQINSYINELLDYLPHSERCFMLLNTEPILAHVERASMLLYNFLKISPIEILVKLKDDEKFKQRLFKIVRHFSQYYRGLEWDRNPYNHLMRRTIESLRIVNDCDNEVEDNIEIGIGFGSSGEPIINKSNSDSKSYDQKPKSKGILSDKQIEVQSILLIPYIDRACFNDLERLIEVGDV